LAASDSSLGASHLQGPKMQVVADAGAAVAVLLIAAALSIYKPTGRTDEPAPQWVRVSGAILVLLIIAIAIRHLSNGGMRSHF
jgi:protein-S-isoprenylcysteine O-methyltransferase Ste14